MDSLDTVVKLLSLDSIRKEDERVLLTLPSSCCACDRAADAALLAIITSKSNKTLKIKRRPDFVTKCDRYMALTASSDSCDLSHTLKCGGIHYRGLTLSKRG